MYTGKSKYNHLNQVTLNEYTLIYMHVAAKGILEKVEDKAMALYSQDIHFPGWSKRWLLVGDVRWLHKIL